MVCSCHIPADSMPSQPGRLVKKINDLGREALQAAGRRSSAYYKDDSKLRWACVAWQIAAISFRQTKSMTPEGARGFTGHGKTQNGGRRGL
jgi:hypothetical protein